MSLICCNFFYTCPCATPSQVPSVLPPPPPPPPPIHPYIPWGLRGGGLGPLPSGSGGSGEVDKRSTQFSPLDLWGPGLRPPLGALQYILILAVFLGAWSHCLRGMGGTGQVDELPACSLSPLALWVQTAGAPSGNPSLHWLYVNKVLVSPHSTLYSVSFLLA